MKYSIGIKVFLIILLISGCSGVKENITRELSNQKWIFTEKGKNDTLTASVPGCVQTDLLSNKKISDFYYRLNENDLQWIGAKDWIYETRFDVPKDIFSKTNILLQFQGLDTYAKVFINDSLVLSADNFFRVWELDAKKILNEKNNHMKIEFTSSVGINTSSNKEAKIKLADDYVYTRKPAYHYGWDWGPVFVTTGIWRPIIIKGWDEVKIIDLQIYQKELSKENAKLDFVYELQVAEKMSVLLEIENSSLNKSTSKSIELNKGANFVQLSMLIDNPKLWWPNGLGEAFLYKFNCKVFNKNKTVDMVSKNFGLRTVKLIQKPDSLGKSFYFEVNGVPVFMKGANYIPQDMFVSRPTEIDYRNTIKQAVAANMNMLRVWGGGFYENDFFYDLCDKNGIMVWQDFMYACAMYPGDEKFLANAKQEAVENVKRLRNHPSIALWCGNNENYVGWKDWKWPKRFSKADSATVWNDYEKLFHRILPEVITTYDPDRFYWPSSPKHGWGYPVNADGDVHYWGIWHAQEPFENFTKPQFIGRFMSEYGFQGSPEFNSIKKFTEPQDWSISSDVMKLHQKHRIGFPVIDKYIKWYFQWPKDFQSYLYVSQLVQAQGIGLAIETHRAAMPHCMGTLYWQINDLYPVTSWASIDVYGNWKALHYRVRELYNDVIIVPQLNEKYLTIKIVSDRLTNFDGKLNMELLDFTGKKLWDISKQIPVIGNSSTKYFEIALDDLLLGFDKTKVVLNCTLNGGNELITSRQFYLVHAKDLLIENPELTNSVEKIENDYLITLESKKLAKNLFISFDGIEGSYSNNYFDMLPNQKYQVKFTPNNPVADIKGKCKIISLYDSYEK